MLDLGRLNPRLTNRRLHRAPGPAAIFRPRGQVIGISRGAIPHQLNNRFSSARQSMFQRFNHQNPCALAHHKPIAVTIKRTRRTLRRVIERTGQRPRRRKSAQTHAINRRLSTAADGNICLAATNHPRRIANRLNTRRARRHGRAQRPLETMLDRNIACCEVDQKRRDRERRQTTRATAVRDPNRLGNRTETTHARTNDRRRALLSVFAVSNPTRLRHRLLGRRQCVQNEAVHLLLLFRRRSSVHIEPGLGVIGDQRHNATDLARQIRHHLFWQTNYPGTARQQTLPHRLHATAQR